MAETLKRLRREHQLMRRLLDLVERELAVFDEAGEPDYDLLLDIADYSLAFPARHHHPAEDRVLARLKARDQAAAEAVGALEREHEELLDLTRRFHAALDGISRDVDLPRANFDHIVGNFLRFYRAHIDREDQFFLPAAERALSPEDWAAVDAEVETIEDPFVTADPGQAFESLRRALKEADERREA